MKQPAQTTLLILLVLFVGAAYASAILYLQASSSLYDSISMIPCSYQENNTENIKTILPDLKNSKTCQINTECKLFIEGIDCGCYHKNSNIDQPEGEVAIIKNCKVRPDISCRCLDGKCTAVSVEE